MWVSVCVWHGTLTICFTYASLAYTHTLNVCTEVSLKYQIIWMLFIYFVIFIVICSSSFGVLFFLRFFSLVFVFTSFSIIFYFYLIPSNVRSYVNVGGGFFSFSLDWDILPCRFAILMIFSVQVDKNCSFRNVSAPQMTRASFIYECICTMLIWYSEEKKNSMKNDATAKTFVNRSSLFTFIFVGRGWKRSSKRATCLSDSEHIVIATTL